MKSSSKNRRRMDRNNQANAAHELIQEITEHVNARVATKRRARQRNNSENMSPVATTPLVETQATAPSSAIAPESAGTSSKSAPPTSNMDISLASNASVPPASNISAPPVSFGQDINTPAPVTIAPDSIFDAQAAAFNLQSAKPFALATQAILAIFCYEDATSPLGQYVADISNLLAQRGITAHIFSRKSFTNVSSTVQTHEIGECPADNLVASAQDFSNRAQAAFARHFNSGDGVTLLGQEWATIPAVLALGAKYNCSAILSLHSLECQRSDMSSELSQKIKNLELQGLSQARVVLFQQIVTVEAARKIAPNCACRFVLARQSFPIQDFICALDAGEVKKRIQVGPVDPLILFIGNLDERHGPDLLIKALPAVLKNHKQVRLAFVGDGALQWPLRVHARYLLLEHAVRILGHLAGQPLHELIHACDMIAMPSRELTSEWPILAGWAASKPVFATHNATKSLIKHDHNGLLVYPSENSCVWGIERILNNMELRSQLGRNGHQKLQECYGVSSVVEQLQELIGHL